MTDKQNPVDEVLARLEGVKKSGEGYSAYCPAHEDRKRPSLTVTPAEDGRVLVNCHKACTFFNIMKAIGLEAKDAFPKPLKPSRNRREYRVRDHHGRVVAVHHREDDPQAKKKKVWWTTPDGKTGLGGLKGESLPLWGAEAVSAVCPSEPIVVCEGEKAASALAYRGIPAVGTVTGAAGTPSRDTLAVLKGRRVVLWPDADEEGHKHMRRIGKQLAQLGCAVSLYEWEDAPEKGDAADHPEILRGEPNGLGDELGGAPEFVPPHDPATDGAATFAYLLDDYLDLLKLRRKEGGITGIRTGIPSIDNQLHGLNKGYSYIVAARPNVGKSLLSGQVALTAAQAGHRVLLATPEMSGVQYLDRFACYLGGVDYFKAQEGRINDSDLNRIRGGARMLSSLPIFVDEYGSQDVARIRENIELHEPDLVVVDYLQYVRPDDPRASRNQQVGQISRDVSALKSEFNIPVVVAAQLNRAIEARGQDAEPQLSDLRDSGELEQDADVVMMLHRPDKQKGEVEADQEEVKVLCRKNRTGRLWGVSLSFVYGQQWLTEDRYGRDLP